MPRRGRLKRAFFDNLLLKAVSLALAALLFYTVRSERHSLAQGTVKLVVTPPSGRILASDPPATLRVGVLGPASRIQRFRFEDLHHINVNLRERDEGYFKFSNELVKLPAGFTVASIWPAGFSVRYAEVVRRHVLLRATLEGQVAPGYQVVRSVVSPARVIVSGPKKVVEALVSLRTAPIRVEGAKSDLLAHVGWAPPPKGVNVHGASRLQVRVSVARLTQQVRLTSIPVVVVDAARGRSHSLSPEVVDVIIAGSTEALANVIKAKLLAKLRLKASYRGVLELSPTVEGLAPGLSLRAVVPDRIRVELGRVTSP